MNEKLGKSQFEPPAGSTIDKQVVISELGKSPLLEHGVEHVVDARLRKRRKSPVAARTFGIF